MFFKPRRSANFEAQQAREISERIARHADSLQRDLQAYQRAKDPFAAMMADLYNRDQVARIFRGNVK